MSDRQSGKGERELTQALEMYVKTIHELEEEFGAAAPSDIAEKLSVKAPSVTSALQKLDSLGMVDDPVPCEMVRFTHLTIVEIIQ